MQIVKKVTQGTRNARLARVLFAYQLAPQSTIGVSQSELLLGRWPWLRLDLVRLDTAEHVEAKERQQKVHHDASARARPFKLETQCLYRVSAKVTNVCLEESLKVSLLCYSSFRVSPVNCIVGIKMTCSINQMMTVKLRCCLAEFWAHHCWLTWVIWFQSNWTRSSNQWFIPTPLRQYFLIESYVVKWHHRLLPCHSVIHRDTDRLLIATVLDFVVVKDLVSCSWLIRDCGFMYCTFLLMGGENVVHCWHGFLMLLYESVCSCLVLLRVFLLREPVEWDSGKFLVRV